MSCMGSVLFAVVARVHSHPLSDYFLRGRGVLREMHGLRFACSCCGGDSRSAFDYFLRGRGGIA